jgi:hypothetical protein
MSGRLSYHKLWMSPIGADPMEVTVSTKRTVGAVPSHAASDALLGAITEAL